MELWIRYRQAERLEWDRCVQVASKGEWLEWISDPGVVSSVLWPTAPLFPPAGPHYCHRRHAHERDYRDDPARNRSFLEGCRALADRLCSVIGDGRCLVYAPLRGALMIWQCIRQFLPDARIDTYWPVTSSFVFYPIEYGILGKHGGRASGRFTNILELERLKPLLAGYDSFLYVDEIISGGMMWGHLKEMITAGIHELLPLFCAGLADSHGSSSHKRRAAIEKLVTDGLLAAFLWEGCDSLITEDQRFLLGIHYMDNRLGPHVVPMLDESLAYYEEKRLFDSQVFVQRQNMIQKEKPVV